MNGLDDVEVDLNDGASTVGAPLEMEHSNGNFSQGRDTATEVVYNVFIVIFLFRSFQKICLLAAEASHESQGVADCHQTADSNNATEYVCTNSIQAQTQEKDASNHPYNKSNMEDDTLNNEELYSWTSWVLKPLLQWR